VESSVAVDCNGMSKQTNKCQLPQCGELLISGNERNNIVIVYLNLKKKLGHHPRLVRETVFTRQWGERTMHVHRS
jgi:hypothetical protein